MSRVAAWRALTLARASVPAFRRAVPVKVLAAESVRVPWPSLRSVPGPEITPERAWLESLVRASVLPVPSSVGPV